MIQTPFHNLNIFFLQQLLYSCHGIPSSKHADSTLSYTQVYPCSCCIDLCLTSLTSALMSQNYVNSLQVCAYSSLACQIDFSFTLGQQKGRLAMPYQYVFLASLILHHFILLHSYLSGTTLLGLSWLDFFSLRSTFELEIKYIVSACCECFIRACFTSA